MKKNKGLIITIVVIVLVALWGISSYNGLVGMDENVSNKWANVETQYQRRSDLIPNLVNTVKGYAKHESQTLEAVMAARSQATQGPMKTMRALGWSFFTIRAVMTMGVRAMEM